MDKLLLLSFTKKKKKELLEEDWEVDEGSDYPVHEKYTKEEPVKEA